MSTITTRSTSAAQAAPESRRAALSELAELVLVALKPAAVPLLRIALGVVYVWFGVLKIVGASPIAELVASMAPFLPAQTVVIGMGVAEVLLGAALLVGVLIPWVAAAQVLHLLATFAVFVVRPDAAFVDGNPLLVTLEGEFIAKNLVLVAALLVVAAYSGPRPWYFVQRLLPSRAR